MTNHRPPALDRVFHALADATRRGMVARLTKGPASVSELAEPHAMALPTVLQHVKVLEESGLVKSEKQGRVRTCRLEPQALAGAEAWLADRRAAWERHFDRLEKFLADEDDTEPKAPGRKP